MNVVVADKRQIHSNVYIYLDNKKVRFVEHYRHSKIGNVEKRKIFDLRAKQDCQSAKRNHRVDQPELLILADNKLITLPPKMSKIK